MSPEKQKIAIAEACEWEKGVHKSLTVLVWRKDGIWVQEQSLPDYLNDLNAMHEAFLSLSDIDKNRMTGFLLMQVGSENRVGIENFSKLLGATPSQWAEAFLRTLGKWVEE